MLPTGSTIKNDPPPDIIVTWEALETFQFRVVELPNGKTAGLASKRLMTGNPAAGGAALTDTIAAAITLPAALTAVKM
jgi:hypothetical protein